MRKYVTANNVRVASSVAQIGIAVLINQASKRDNGLPLRTLPFREQLRYMRRRPIMHGALLVIPAALSLYASRVETKEIEHNVVTARINGIFRLDNYPEIDEQIADLFKKYPEFGPANSDATDTVYDSADEVVTEGEWEGWSRKPKRSDEEIGITQYWAENPFIQG